MFGDFNPHLDIPVTMLASRSSYFKLGSETVRYIYLSTINGINRAIDITLGASRTNAHIRGGSFRNIFKKCVQLCSIGNVQLNISASFIKYYMELFD